MGQYASPASVVYEQQSRGRQAACILGEHAQPDYVAPGKYARDRAAAEHLGQEHV